MKKTTKKRIEDIYSYILKKEKVSTIELAKNEGVSPEMIRKYLDILEERGSIIRYHGGASIRKNGDTPPFSARIYENKSIKDELCYKAVEFINDGDVVFIDASTTTLQLGRLIRPKNNLTIVTNCLETLELACSSQHKIILVGGEYSKSGDRLIGYFSLEIIRRLTFDISFLGTDGCKDLEGPGTYSEHDIAVTQEVLRHSKKSVLMMDSTKFQRTPPYLYANFSEFDILITDKEDIDKMNIPIKL